jgi:hypothetical protein
MLQRIFPLAFALAWSGGAIVLGVRLLRKQGAYLRRFPPVEGVPLDDFVVTTAFRSPWGAVNRAIRRVSWQRQDDPELERLRREVGRSVLHLAVWIYGFPLLTLGVAALLIATGVVRAQ